MRVIYDIGTDDDDDDHEDDDDAIDDEIEGDADDGDDAGNINVIFKSIEIETQYFILFERTFHYPIHFISLQDCFAIQIWCFYINLFSRKYKSWDRLTSV